MRCALPQLVKKTNLSVSGGKKKYRDEKRRKKVITRSESSLFRNLQETISLQAVTGKRSENFTKLSLFPLFKKKKARVFSCHWLQPKFSKYSSASQKTTLASSSNLKKKRGG